MRVVLLVTLHVAFVEEPLHVVVVAELVEELIITDVLFNGEEIVAFHRRKKEGVGGGAKTKRVSFGWSSVAVIDDISADGTNRTCF